MRQAMFPRITGPLKRMLPSSLWRPVRAVATGLLTPLRFSARTGHWTSSLHQSARAPGGAALPWYTYPAIDFLAQRSFADKNVLEFGGGQSTLWWAPRAKTVMTVEEDGDWYQSLLPRVPANVTLKHAPIDRAAPSIEPVRAMLAAHPVSKFDVIVIDGHLRKKLVSLAFERLAPGGALILDNAEGFGFHEEIRDVACRRIDFFGFAPGVSMRHCTSLVYVDDCFLLDPRLPIVDIESAASGSPSRPLA